MDVDALKRWVLRRLGAPIWKIEFTPEHVDDSVEEAIRWFAAKKGAYRLGILTIQPGVVEYTLSNEVDVVLDVHFSSPESDLSLIFSPFLILDEKVPYDVFAAPQSVGLYSSYVQTLQYIETAKRVLSAELDWEWAGRGARVGEGGAAVATPENEPARDAHLRLRSLFSRGIDRPAVVERAGVGIDAQLSQLRELFDAGGAHLGQAGGGRFIGSHYDHLILSVPGRQQATVNPCRSLV